MQHYSSTQTLFNTQAICHASACDQAKSMAILAPLAYHTVEAWRLRHCSVTERQMQGLYLERAGRAPPPSRQGELLQQLQRLAAELCCQGGDIEAQPQVSLPHKDVLQQVRDLQGLIVVRLCSRMQGFCSQRMCTA